MREPPLVQGFEPMEEYSPADEDWTSDVYDRLNGTPRRRGSSPCACCATTITATPSSFSKAVATAYAGTILGCGALLLLWAAVIRYRPEWLSGTPKNSAALSRSLADGGLLLALFGLITVSAHTFLRHRKGCALATAVLWSVLALLTAALVVCTTYSDLAHHSVLSDRVLEQAWKTTVKVSPALICSLETELGCSGFAGEHCCLAASLDRAGDASVATPCYLIDANHTARDVATREVVTWPEELCVAGCELSEEDVGKRTCEAPIRDAVSRVRHYIVAVALLLTVLSVWCAAWLVIGAVPHRHTGMISFVRYDF